MTYEQAVKVCLSKVIFALMNSFVRNGHDRLGIP